MTYQPVSSSCIAEIGYEPSHRTLAIRFRGGREYCYADIAPEMYQALLAAASIGSYFNARVRNAYPYQRTR